MPAPLAQPAPNQGSRLFAIPVVIWLTAVSLSFVLTWRQQQTSLVDIATSEARASYNKDLAYRRWAAMHGGVYVPPTPRTPPNPHLAHVPHRDITTTEGKNLTLINPAYMTRQVHELEKEQYGVRGHITSLNPIRPENAPDAWEAEALKAFETGTKEVVALATMDGKPFLRFMRAMITEAPCLKCHAAQGYEEGDVRGGISVSVPFTPFQEIGDRQRNRLLLGHATLGLLGVLALLWWRGRQARFEDTLRASEARYRIVADNTYDWEFWLSEHRDLRYISPSCQRITGYSREEFYADPGLLEAIIHPEDRPLYQEHVCRVNSQPAAEELALRIIHRDGHIVWLGHSCQPMYDDQGQLLGVRGSNRDITTMKRGEDWMNTRLALREHASRCDLDSFLNKALDEAERLTASSIGFLHFLDADQETIHLQAWSTNTTRNMCSAEGTGQHYPLSQAGVWADCIRERRPVVHNDYATLSHRRGLPEGHAPVVRELAVPILRHGLIVAIVGVGNKASDYDDSDVSILSDFSNLAWDLIQQKQAEEEKARLEIQLRQAQKMEAIGTLAGGIAHDFNNILTAVLGYAEMAQEDSPPGSPVHGHLREILGAGERARELVKQILAFSRQSEREMKPLHLHLVVKEAIKLLRASIPSTVEIRQDIDEYAGTVMADPTQIHQIMMNLCTNAYQAMQTTGGTLSIGLRTAAVEQDDPKVNGFQLAAGDHVVLEVSDNGSGMDKKTLERIFDPYFTTKAKGQGTGLGLAVVHGIVKSCGGHISVYSEPGTGTTFRVYLPKITAATAEEEPASASPLPRGTEHILLVDDEEAIAALEQSMLLSLGYQVTALTNPKDALRLFQQTPKSYDLVFTDMTMPQMTGTDLTRRLREIRADLPVILCTGFSELINKETAVDFGLDGYLTKPLLKRDLARTVREALDKRAHKG